MDYIIIIKILAGAAALAAGILGGRHLSGRLTKRSLYLDEAVIFCDLMTAEVLFLHTRLESLLEEKSDGFKSEFAGHLRAAAKILSENGDFSATSIYARLTPGAATKEERETVAALLAALAVFDGETVERITAGYKARLLPLQAAATEKRKKYSGMYVKLGVLAGALICVLLI